MARKTTSRNASDLRLTHYTYAEMSGEDSEWTLSKFRVRKTNLLVGRNATGKSRVLNTIRSLAIVLKSQPEKLYKSGEWQVVFSSISGDEYKYHLKIAGREVFSEKLHVNGELRLTRTKSGLGKIWNDQTKSMLEFEVGRSGVALFLKRDTKQHNFIEPIRRWAENVRYYPFGTDFGRTIIFADDPYPDATDKKDEDRPSLYESNQVVALYCRGYERFGDAFDEAILSDLRVIGYPCSRIDAVYSHTYMDEEINLPNNKVPVYIALHEKDLSMPTRQAEMSAGMFRSLALIVHINFCRLARKASTILIDDIGEGLDFQRATALIDLVQERTSSAGLQVIMSTNDRFVMNEVDFEFWKLIERTGSNVKILDLETSPELFEGHKFLGLNNFDLYANRVRTNFAS